MLSTDDVFAQALQLPADDREMLVVRLLGSLESRPDLSYDEAWAAEFEARMEDYESGRVIAIPADEAFREALADLRGSTEK